MGDSAGNTELSGAASVALYPETGCGPASLNKEALIDAALRSFTSPIEGLWVRAMGQHGWKPTKSEDAWAMAAQHVALSRDSVIWSFDDDNFVCVPQLREALQDRRVIIDFAYFAGEGRFAVELDGHDFHEKTKEQAARDHSRDRLLTLEQWVPLRFTGSEVFSDPSGCLAEVMAFLVEADLRWSRR